MLISAGIFDLVLVFILRRKCLIVLVTLVILVFHSFSLALVDEKSLHCQLLAITFSQTAVANIYFGSYFMFSIETQIVINYSVFRPNQLNL